ncbi:MAG TPA: hypothetical protein VMU27_03170 [Candidatus Paceibacterota bacterium]|nr:hypothetical protein [Candidatus Paceibacterota bacterium]
MGKTWYACIIGAAVFLGLVPWIVALILNHGVLSVPPEFANDSEYYYAQVHDVAIGYPFIGNPYYKEYRDEPATSFFGAAWIAAIPLLAGIPIVPALAIDFGVAFGIYTTLLLMLGVRLGMRRWWGVALITAALGSSYWLMERPVSMQVVFPCFVFFLLSYYLWLKDPESRASRIALILSSALAFYVYTYSWQIMVVVFALTHALFLFSDRKKFISLLWIDLPIVILSSPVIWYTYYQIHQPWYWQTMTRTGLVETHTIGSSSIFVILISAFMLGAIRLFGRYSRDHEYRAEILFLAITGLSILITSFSNVITGKDVETAIHLIRFEYVWAAIAGVYALWLYAHSRPLEWRAALTSSSGLYAIAIVAFVAYFLYGALQGFPGLLLPSTVATQDYGAPLEWLNENAPAGSVVFADDYLSYYVPVMTRDYVLFQPDGGLYLMPDSQVQNRYLASRMFDNLSLEDLEGEVRWYAGAGNADDAPETLDRWPKICMLLIRNNCPPMVSAVSYLGAPYFDDMYQRYQNVIAHPAQTLQDYQVSYIIKDTKLDSNMHPEELEGTNLVATLGRFEIYTFDATSSMVSRE